MVLVAHFTESYQPIGLVTKSAPAEILGPNSCPCHDLPMWRKREKKNNLVCFDTRPHCLRPLCLSVTLIRVTCSGSCRLSHLQHSAKTTVRLPPGFIQISHCQPSAEILAGDEDAELAIRWIIGLLWGNSTPRCPRWSVMGAFAFAIDFDLQLCFFFCN